MPGSSYHDFRNTELNLDLFSTPFKVQTNWCVITGAACSGKTTLVDQLADKRFQTVPEAGRQFFDSEMAKGRTIEEIRKDRATITYLIFDIMGISERGLQ
jgi:predicted ATPase